MENKIVVKAKTAESLHSMAVNIIALANKFSEKYPEFAAVLNVDHKTSEITLNMSRVEEDE